MPPDPVAEAAHPVAVLSSVSGVAQCTPTNTSTNAGEVQCTFALPVSSGSSQGGCIAGLAGGEAGHSEGTSSTTTTTATTTTTTTTPQPQQPPIMYLLTPELRQVFQPVGATNKPYTFREVLIFLKNYLFSHTHLFDVSNKLYVNCGGDPLGLALGVERFHYNHTRYVISRNLIPIQSTAGGGVVVTSVPVTVSPTTVTITTAAPQPPPQRTTSLPTFTVNPTAAVPQQQTLSQRCNSVPPFSLVNNISNVTNDRTTGLGVQNRMPLTPQPSAQLSILPGTSRETDTARQNALPEPTVEIPVPDIPDSCSDMESVYSYQGYETAYCRNTEFETSDEEEEVQVELEGEAFEEYELASDDPKEEEHSDDSDSMIEDVEVAAVLAYTLVQEVSGEEADDSDTDDQSAEDPELVGERWDCLSCGLKNKPFVRYCSKCWQLRKNWLPDRPKRRKRKPRPKKRHQRQRTESLVSDEPSCERPAATATNITTSKTQQFTCTPQQQQKQAPSISPLSMCHQYVPSTSSHSVSSTSTGHQPVVSISHQSIHPTSQQQQTHSASSHSTSHQYVHSTVQLMVPNIITTSSPLYDFTSSQPQPPSLPLSSATAAATPPHHPAFSRGDSCLELEELPRTSSNASTVSLGSTSPERTYNIYQHCSQDSGISSQDTEDLSMEMPARSIEEDVVDAGGVSSSSSRTQVTGVQIHSSTAANTVPVIENVLSENQRIQAEDVKRNVPLGSGGGSSSSSSKRRRSSGPEEGTPRKRCRTGDDQQKQDEALSATLDSEIPVKDIIKFIEASSGKFIEKQDLLSFIKSRCANKGKDVLDGCSTEDDLDSSQTCSICFLRPKNATIVHGRLAHQATCYQCARRLLKAGSRCPVCRRKIHMVAKNIVA